MRILFIPEEIRPEANERTPKLRELLAEGHTVVGIKDKLAHCLYNPRKNKLLRYVAYFANNAYLLLLSLRDARRNEIDLVFCEGAHYAVIGVSISKLLHKPCVWDSHGNAAIFCRQLGKPRFYTFMSTALEKVLGEQTDALVTVTEKDRQAYTDMGIDPGKIHVIPTAVDFLVVSKTAKRPEDVRAELGLMNGHIMLLFFGSLDYQPNREAFNYINRELAPKLAGEFPYLRFVVAGKGEHPSSLHESICIVGFVPNIYDLIRAADICIAPVWSGVGILTKVLDMMATGKPTVVTPLAKDGIPELVDGWNVLLAQDRDDFVKKTEELIRRKELCDSLGKRAKETISTRYTWDRARMRLDELFQRLCRGESKAMTEKNA